MEKNLLIIFLLYISVSISFGQFGPQQEITNPAYGAKDVYSSDIDGDGDMDLLSASFDDNTIAWYENTDGNGNFSPQKNIITNLNGAYSVYSSDIDGDGDMDVLSASSNDNKIAWYENTDGNGNFGAQQIISTLAEGARSVYSSDIDGDGDMDVLSASWNDDKIAWYENINGNGNFGAQQIISTLADGAYSIYTSDLDADGDMDILSASAGDDKIAWYENTDGNGDFGPQQIISSLANYAASVYTNDIDGDGDMDVLSASYIDDKIAWYENTDGNGNFGAQQVISTLTDGAYSVYSSDIDGDGDMDVLSASSSDDKIAWYENINGNFGTQQIISTLADGANSVYSEDLDGDGDMDVLSSSLGDDKIAWYENTDGNGNFGPQQVVTNYAYSATSVLACDIDGDGDIDVLSASWSDNKIAWYENINGNFGAQQIISTLANGARSVYSADLDGDGDIDVLSASSNDAKIAWYENTDGNGDFGAEQIIENSAFYTNCVYSADLDSDGDMDILAKRSTNIISWFENTDGNGNFGLEQIITNHAFNVSSIYSADLDGDGDMDVLSTSTNDDEIAWYENTDGNGNFGPEQIITSSINNPWSVYSVDLDNDGDMDVLSASRDDDTVAWYENMDGNGNFGPQQIISTIADGAYSVYSADLDDDGDMDVLSASINDNKIAWYENIDGNGNFEPQQIISTIADGAHSVYSADLDGDGDMDVLSASHFDSKIAWYENYIYGSRYKLYGSLFIDINQNTSKDSNEYGFTYSKVELNPIALASFTNIDGEFWFAVDTGNYILTYLPIQNWNLTTDLSEYHIHLTTNEPIADSLDFGFYPNSFITGLYPELISSPSICGSEATFWLNYQNQGTTNPDGIVELILDNSITFVSSILSPDSIIGQNIYWHFDSLNFFASEQIPIIVQMPDFNSMGDTLLSILNIYTTDSTGQFFFTDTLSEELACSYDPNDKLVTPRGEGTEGVISKDETLEYTVRFQNTGNAEATNIKIRDQIDVNLDIASIQILASSHDVQAYIQQNRWLVFQFDSIMLPDSTSNELESHGFVKFSITIDEAVLPNTQIFNTAHIYFDYNPAVITNTVMNTIECYMAPEMPVITQNDDILEVNSTAELQWFFNGTLIQGATNTTYQFTENGDYSVVVFDENDCFTESEVYTVSNVDLDNIYTNNLSVYPNPTKDFVVIESDLEELQTCSIYTIDGQLVKTIPFNRHSKHIISTKSWGKGLYVVRLGELSRKLLVE